MQALIDEVLPALEPAMSEVGIQGDFWRQMLGRSKEASQGDLALPCFPFAKQLGCSSSRTEPPKGTLCFKNRVRLPPAGTFPHPK